MLGASSAKDLPCSSYVHTCCVVSRGHHSRVIVAGAAIALLVTPFFFRSCSHDAKPICGAGHVDVRFELVASIADYPIEHSAAGINVSYRTRTWCDGSKNETDTCKGLGIFGPVLSVRPGDRLQIVVHNRFSVEEARALGPSPPDLETWFELANNVSGRYAGLQSCGFVFTGKAPSTPAEFRRDTTNMPGHYQVGFEGTNLHLHGMEIKPHLFSPLGTSDPAAEMIRIKPGESMCYDFEIPANHPAGGTYWFHPHMHSTVAIQAWSGMAGLIKVLGALDELLPAHGIVQDIPFVIWDPHFRPLENSSQAGGNAEDHRRLLLGPRQPLGVDHFLHAQTDQSIIWYLVNAEYQPTYHLRPSETIRLRVLCATTENLAGFEVLDESGEQQPFWQIGSDGVSFRAPVQRTRLVLSGGMREEILVQLSKPGRYRVASRNLTKIQFFCTGPDDAVLAFLEVRGEPWPEPIPNLMRLPLPPPPKQAILAEEIVQSRTVVMSMKADRSRVPFPQFMQNGKPYNETAVEFQIRAGTAEEWIVLNPDRTMHPMHLHVSPFQVKEIRSSYMPDDVAMQEITRLDPELDNWRDTITVPAQGFVKLWIRWGHFKGKSVAHCHFLAHEDTGMIMNIMLN